MSEHKRGPGRPRKVPSMGGQFSGEKDLKKKLKVDSDSLYHPQFNGDEDDGNYYDDMSNSGGEYDPSDEDPKRRSTSSAMKEKTKARHDNSLSVLTKKFIDLIRTSPDYTVDLNEAVKKLNVQKRRIYDITNVLEGINYIRKVHKNKIQWTGNEEAFDSDHEMKMMAQEMDALAMEEKDIDKWTNTLQDMLAELANNEMNQKFSYVSFEEINNVHKTLKNNDQPFLVIGAPSGTLLEVPPVEENSNQGFPHQMKLTNKDEEICIYIVSSEDQGQDQVVTPSKQF